MLAAVGVDRVDLSENLLDADRLLRDDKRDLSHKTRRLLSKKKKKKKKKKRVSLSPPPPLEKKKKKQEDAFLSLFFKKGTEGERRRSLVWGTAVTARPRAFARYASARSSALASSSRRSASASRAASSGGGANLPAPFNDATPRTSSGCSAPSASAVKPPIDYRFATITLFRNFEHGYI